MIKKLNNKIIVILGPTSSGKSDIAIKLAKKFDGEIISADSRQIYRGLDIGTGKITKSEQKLVKHWMIDIAGPKTKFNVAQFKKRADKIILDILKRKKLPIICGGTGFWIKAIVDNIAYPEVKPDWKLRKKLSDKSAERLFLMLQKLDLARAKNIDKNNKVRLIRAIEICKTLGKVPKPIRINESFEFTNEPASKFVDSYSFVDSHRPYNFLQIGIAIPKEKLLKNIKKRLRQRFEAGMIEEVQKLRKLGLSWKKIQQFGLGYFWIPLYLQGEIKTKEELFEKIYQAEKDYAKRQMTWFRKDKRIKWIEKYKDIEKEVKLFLKNN